MKEYSVKKAIKLIERRDELKQALVRMDDQAFKSSGTEKIVIYKNIEDGYLNHKDEIVVELEGRDLVRDFYKVLQDKIAEHEKDLKELGVE